jgi:magnesium-transporting ATPase (P-type)
MNVKKFWIAVVVVFVLAQLTGYLIHVVMLGPTYESEGIKEIFRSMEEMNSKKWIMWVTDLVWVFFFTYIFVKGYENKGLLEGIKYGIYIGLFIPFVFAYQSYVIYPVPYSLAFQWFLYGVIQCVIYGLVVAAIYKPKEVNSNEA